MHSHKTSRNRLFFFMGTSIMLVTGLYLAFRLFWLCDFSFFVRLLGSAIILVLSQCMFGMRYVVSFTPHMSYLALKACGFCSAYFICLASFVFLHDILCLGYFLYFDAIPHYGFSSSFSLMVFCLSFVVMVYGSWKALKIPRFRYHDLYVEDLPQELAGMRIIHLSDFHIGSTFDGKWLSKLIRKINQEEVDLVVVTGDLVDATPKKIEKDVIHLQNVRSRLGIHICLGNHEYFCGANPWIEKWRSWGFHVYVNENRKFHYHNYPFYVAGSADFEGSKFPGLLAPDMEKTLKGIKKEDFTILLQHQPRKARENSLLGVDIQLSGHTHGGQYFFLFPVIWLMNRGFRNGFYKLGKMSLYVSSGSGLWGYVPLRFGTTSEVLVHTLKKRP